ncbi:ABC transporter ATP-binding protein [Streptomyces sp. NPDC002680]|uniref:ABC transporter ATP-binding protein n=1 Tax=Streptomyces sp. NPDC002680 TaxID=3364659 RepID=UPI0036C383E2
MNPLLEVRNLGVVYRGRGRRKDKVALDGVSVEVGAGETLGLVGESGSGKSTLGGCVLGLVRPASGSVVFDGRDITRLPARARRALGSQIQAVFQDPYSSFNPHRTIEQSVAETLTSVHGVSPDERRDRVIAMLERVGLDRSALAKFPAQFSGGQRQRIAIARALLPEPRLVVCDESVSALDLSVQAQVLNLLLELQRELRVAYLFITHDLAVVRHMSTRIAVLEHGHLVEHGDAEEVTGNPQEPYTRRLLLASPQADPDLQDARRRARRAVAALVADAAGDDRDRAGRALAALERQAVAETLAQPDRSTVVLEVALSRFAEDPDDFERFVDLRSAILELSPRTSADAMPDPARSRIDDARRRLCNAHASRGDVGDVVARIRELSAAVGAGDEAGVQAIASSLEPVLPFDDRAEPERTKRTGVAG